MHEYYEKNRVKLKKKMKDFLSLVSPELESISKESFGSALEEIWSIYERDMLGRFPYIGGDRVSGTKNLTEAYMLVAMGEYLKGYRTEIEEIGRLMTLAYERRMMKTVSYTHLSALRKNPSRAATPNLHGAQRTASPSPRF